MPREFCPDYYDWLDEQGCVRTLAKDAPQEQFLQLPVYDHRPPSSVPATQPVASDTAWQLEQRTRTQASSMTWAAERSHRLTASKFHDVVRRKKAIDDEFLQRLFSSDSAASIALAPLAHGQAYEDQAALDYVETSLKMGKEVKVFRTGLCVHPGYMATSAPRQTA